MISTGQILDEGLKEINASEQGLIGVQDDQIRERRKIRQNNVLSVSRYGFCSEDTFEKYCQVSSAVETNGSAS